MARLPFSPPGFTREITSLKPLYLSTKAVKYPLLRFLLPPVVLVLAALQVMEPRCALAVDAVYSPRADALGWSGAALLDDSGIATFSPAAVDRRGTAFILSGIRDVSGNYGGQVLWTSPTESGAAGIAVSYYGAGLWDAPDIGTRLQATPFLGDYAARVLVMERYAPFRAGLSVGVMRSQRPPDDAGLAGTIDAGLAWEGIRGLSAGLLLRNLGTTLTYWRQPPVFPESLRLGAAYQVGNLPIVPSSHSLSVVGDGEYRFDPQTTAWHGGLEYGMGFAAVRVGAEYQDDSLDPAVGVGIRFGKVSLDYSLRYDAEEESSHQFALTYSLARTASATEATASSTDSVPAEAQLPQQPTLTATGAAVMNASFNLEPKTISATMEAGGRWQVEVRGLDNQVIRTISGHGLLPRTLDLTESEKLAAKEWKAEVRDKSERVMRTISGKGVPPKVLEWNVERMLAARKWRVEVTDAKKQPLRVISGEGLPPKTLDLDEAAMASARNWKVDLWNAAETAVRTVAGAGPPPKVLEWDAWSAAPAATWKIEITDSARRVLKTIEGTGGPPKALDWDGLNDRGQPVIDANLARIVVTTVAVDGTERGASRPVPVVSAEAQMVSATARTVDPEVVFGMPRYRYACWLLRVSGDGGSVTQWEGEGTPPDRIVWNGLDDAGNQVHVRSPSFSWSFTDDDGEEALGKRRLPQVEAVVDGEGDSATIRLIGICFDGKATSLSREDWTAIIKASKFISRYPDKALRIESYAATGGTEDDDAMAATARATEILGILTQQLMVAPDRIAVMTHTASTPPPVIKGFSRLGTRRQRVDLVIHKAAAGGAGR